MSRIVYVGAAAQRVKTISKSLSVVPPALGATIAIKWTKIAALAPLVKVRLTQVDNVTNKLSTLID